MHALDREQAVRDGAHDAMKPTRQKLRQWAYQNTKVTCDHIESFKPGARLGYSSHRLGIMFQSSQAPFLAPQGIPATLTHFAKRKLQQNVSICTCIRHFQLNCTTHSVQHCGSRAAFHHNSKIAEGKKNQTRQLAHAGSLRLRSL
jgi:hypothetical protein